jgi:hypothetical protein
VRTVRPRHGDVEGARYPRVSRLSRIGARDFRRALHILSSLDLRLAEFFLGLFLSGRDIRLGHDRRLRMMAAA